MTFVVGNSSQVTGNSLSDQARTITNNIQLIQMNHSRIHRLGAGETVNGFVDTFSDQTGLDSTLTAGSYNNSQCCYTPVSGTSGLTETIQIDEAAAIELCESSGLSITQ